MLKKQPKGKTKTGEEGNLYPLSIKQISRLCLRRKCEKERKGHDASN
jgi:hypothetical protein